MTCRTKSPVLFYVLPGSVNRKPGIPEKGIQQRDADENSQKEDRKQENDHIELVVPVQVHEKHRNHGSFENSNGNGYDHIERLGNVEPGDRHR